MQDRVEFPEAVSVTRASRGREVLSREPALPRDEAVAQLRGLLGGETDLIANTANMSAFLNNVLPDINWVGFYFLRDGELVLGPFQGQAACVRIPLSKGVCGACARHRETQRVDDVHEFPGHIACDARSRSELVVPLCPPVSAQGMSETPVLGVLDIDSPSPARFSAADQDYVEALVDAFLDVQFAS
jgi:GAF domain-containing protein